MSRVLLNIRRRLNRNKSLTGVTPVKAPDVKKGTRLQYGLRTLLAVPIVVAILLATDFLGLVEVRYPRFLENDPLSSPLRVSAIDGNTLTLEDGRTIELGLVNAAGSLEPYDPADDFLETLLDRSSQVVEVECAEDSSSATLYVKAPRGFCGTRDLLPIPLWLIPKDEPRYFRRVLGVGQILQVEDP